MRIDDDCDEEYGCMYSRDLAMDPEGDDWAEFEKSVKIPVGWEELARTHPEQLLRSSSWRWGLCERLAEFIMDK